jgi:hypothetical protein
MKYLPGTWLLLLFSLLMAACASELGDTALLLTVQSDLSVPDEVERITLEGASFDSGRQPGADLRLKPLPRSIELVHETGPYGPLRLTVNAYRADKLVAQRTVDTFFVQGMQSYVQVTITRRCLEVFCAEGLTCDDGTCAPVPRLGTSVEPDAGGDLSEPFDAPDAGSRADAAFDGSTGPSSEAGVGNAEAGSTLRDAAAGSDATLALGDAGTLDAGKDAAQGATEDAGVTLGGGGSDAGALSDAGTRLDAGTPKDAATPVVDSAVPPLGPGARPVCTISKPSEGTNLLLGTSFALQGSCTDAESGALTSGLVWTSQLDGLLGTGGTTVGNLRTAGAHTLRLCAPDPRDEKLIGCGSVQVTAAPAPTARILSLRQGGEDGDFGPLLPIVMQGAGTGIDVTLRWTDSLQGAFGTGATVALPMPMPGKHVVTLEVTDGYGNKASATRSFTVNAVMPRGG